MTSSKIIPDSSLESILDLRSRIANTDAAALLALLLSVAKELDCDIPIAENANAKNTCSKKQTQTCLKGDKYVDGWC